MVNARSVSKIAYLAILAQIVLVVTLNITMIQLIKFVHCYALRVILELPQCNKVVYVYNVNQIVKVAKILQFVNNVNFNIIY